MEANEKVISEILIRLEKLEETVFSSAHFAATPTKSKKISPKEFLLAKVVDSDPQRVLALGYYLEHLEGLESFNVNDLEKVFHAAKVPVPSNLNEKVNKCIARGFIMDAPEKKDSKKAWCLTTSGESHVETVFSKKGA